MDLAFFRAIEKKRIAWRILLPKAVINPDIRSRIPNKNFKSVSPISCPAAVPIRVPMQPTRETKATSLYLILPLYEWTRNAPVADMTKNKRLVTLASVGRSERNEVRNMTKSPPLPTPSPDIAAITKVTARSIAFCASPFKIYPPFEP